MLSAFYPKCLFVPTVILTIVIMLNVMPPQARISRATRIYKNMLHCTGTVLAEAASVTNKNVLWHWHLVESGVAAAVVVVVTVVVAIVVVSNDLSSSSISSLSSPLSLPAPLRTTSGFVTSFPADSICRIGSTSVVVDVVDSVGSTFRWCNRTFSPLVTDVRT
jgi:hypothetical protein